MSDHKWSKKKTTIELRRDLESVDKAIKRLKTQRKTLRTLLKKK